MACNNNCSGCSNKHCGCLNTLRCVHPPMCHCHPPRPPRPEDYPDFPFYSGPCPPCDCDCDTNSCGGCKKCKKCRCCHHCDHCGHHHDCPHTRCEAAMFSADAPISVEAGGNIPLSPRISNHDCFDTRNGCVRIRRSGLYHVTWTANIPSYQSVSARLRLTLNGSEVPGSGQTICTQADNTSTSVTGQAFVSTPPGGTLCLNTCDDLCIGGGCDVDNVFTLTIMKV